MKKLIILILILSVTTNNIVAQTIEKNFLGWWGDTLWEFHFKNNGRYERISSGHFGYTTAKGKYKIENDTIKIISGYENSYGTVNEKYKIDENDILIDLKLGYGYKRILESERNKEMEFHQLLYPEIEPVNIKSVNDIEEVLNLTFNSYKIKSYFHFDTLTSRKFIITNYFKLKANINVDGKKAEFKNKKDIDDKFYIEFESIIRFYDRISFTIKIPDEGIKINCYYGKENGNWKEDIITVVEY